MAIELAALNIPLRTTGREEVLKAFADVDRAGDKAGAAVNIPIKATGAAEAVRSLTSVEALTGKLADKLRSMGVAEKDIPKALERATPALSKLATTTQQLATAQQVQTATSQQQAQAVDAVTASAVKATTATQRLVAGMSQAGREAHAAGAGARAWAAGMATLQAQQTATAGAVVAGSTQAVSGLKRMTAGLQQVAVMAIGTQSAVGSLVTGGLLTLGATAAVTLGVVAGAAVIALAWNRLTRQSRETKEAIKQMREELEALSPQDAAIKNVAIAAAGLAAAEQALSKARERQTVETPEGPVSFAPDPKAIAKAEAEVARFRKNLDDAKRAVGDLAREAFGQETATLAKAIELRTASAHQIQVATERIKLLDAAAKDETKTLAEQNAAQEEANQLRAAFKKLTDEAAAATEKSAEAKRKELDVLLALSSVTDLTPKQIDTLNQRYAESTKALQAKNLTDAEQNRLLTEQRKALEALQNAGARSSATFGRATFGLGGLEGSLPTRGRGLGPDPFKGMQFGADADKTAEFFGGGFDTKALDDSAREFERQLASIGDRVSTAVSAGNLFAFDQLTTSISEGLAQSLVDGIAGGFERGIAEGSIGEGAKALTAALLSGLGSAAIAFGVGALGIAKLMAAIKKALSSLNPAVAIPAAIGLIALGGALKGVASRMFSGGGGGTSGAGAGGDHTSVHRVFVGADGAAREQSRPSASVAVPGTAAQQAARIQPQRNMYNFTLIGANDPTVQRSIADIVNAADSRGLVQVGGG